MDKFYRFVMLMALFLAMGVTNAVNAATVYLNAPSPYTNGDETWYAFNWDGNDIDNGNWAEGTTTSDGLLKFLVTGEKVSFKRTNGTPAHGESTWNMSEDLAAVDNGIYTVSGWDNGYGKLAGYWSTAVYLSPGDYGYNFWYAWAWTGDGAGSWYKGTSSQGKVKFYVPSSSDHIIFASMNNDYADWNNINNNYRSEDLNLIKNGTYTLTGFDNNNNRLKGTWDQTEAGEPILIPNKRKALTGRHCMVNKMVSVVDVASWASGIDNMLDEDLDNFATFPSVATVGVGVNPITSIRDTKNHYAAGTTAGFNLVADAGSLLDLNLASVYSIAFYLEGELKETVAVSSGQSVNGVGLSLINIPSSNDASFDVIAVAPCEFDEIALMPAGVNANVITATKIKYAFVGDYDFYTITADRSEGQADADIPGMGAYAADHNRDPFTLDAYPAGSGGAKIIDADLTNGWSWGVVSVGVSMDAKAISQFDRNDTDQSQCFKKGSTVGFRFSNTSILKLPVGNGIVLRLYKGEWVEKTNILGNPTGEYEWKETEVQSENVGGSILELNVINGGDQFVSIVAKEDFSTARFTTPTGLTLDLGFLKVKYAYVSDPTEVSHYCDLKLSADASVCSKDLEYQLKANEDIPVTWSIESQPSGANATIDANGLLTGMPANIDGEYVIKGTAADGCYSFVTITHGLDLSSASCDEPLYNETDQEVYVLSQVNNGGALIDINNQLEDSENVLNQSYEDYAIYKNSLNGDVIKIAPIVGVKKTNGNSENPQGVNISDGIHGKKVGFVVESTSEGLTADVINILTIRTYKNGSQTWEGAIAENNAVSVKLIGSKRNQKLRFAVTVPYNVEFDEFVLWKNDAITLTIDKFKIYYAFAENVDADDNSNETECFDPLGCASTLISTTTNARIDGNNSQFAGAINAAVVVDNLTYLIDDNINTGISLSKTVSLGNGIVIAVDLGRVYPATQQVGLIMDTKTYLAGVQAGSWITMKTYLNGIEQETKSDWNVLGVNAIGYGDKSYIFMNPTMPYDAVRITIADIAELLTFDSKYYGLFVRNDYDQDGVPDCKDDDSCSEEYTLDEEATTLAKPQDYPDGNLVLHRSFELGEWNCITLPVDLNWLQVRNAFGNKVEIATPDGFYFTPKIQELHGAKLTVLYYKPCTDQDGNIAMEKNKYYIIKPFRQPDLAEGTSYTAKDGVTVNGPVYFIPKVTYLRENEMAGGVVPSMKLGFKAVEPTTNTSSKDGETIPTEENSEIILHGSQVYLDGQVNDNVGVGNYLYGNNYNQFGYNILTRITNESGAPMLGFRFYAENNTPYEIIHEEDWDTPTSITNILSPIYMPTGVYSLDGRLLRTNNNTMGLPPGVYIVAGKKVIITQK